MAGRRKRDQRDRRRRKGARPPAKRASRSVTLTLAGAGAVLLTFFGFQCHGDDDSYAGGYGSSTRPSGSGGTGGCSSGPGSRYRSYGSHDTGSGTSRHGFGFS